MRIGEVHAQLRKIFPDVELSKIRYYEDKGLVQPSRSRKGYRLYSERDVECLTRGDSPRPGRVRPASGRAAAPDRTGTPRAAEHELEPVVTSPARRWRA